MVAPETSFDGYQAPLFLRGNAPDRCDEPNYISQSFAASTHFVFVFYFGSSGTGKKIIPVEPKRLWGGILEEQDGRKAPLVCAQWD